MSQYTPLSQLSVHRHFGPEAKPAWLTAVLAWVLLGFGLFTLFTSWRIVISTYSPVLDWDQWQIVNTLLQSQGHPSLRDLWAQHNEHRPVTGRVLGFVDLWFFRGKNVSLLAEIQLFQLCHLAVFAMVLRRFCHLSTAVYISLVGLFTYCLFSPVQMENFDWGFQVAFIITSLAATTSFCLLLWYRESDGSRKKLRSWFILALSLVFALIAEASEAHGLLVWPALFFMASCLRLPRRCRWVIVCIGVLALGIYLKGYQSPDASPTFIAAYRHPIETLKFVLTIFANSWDQHLPNHSAWPSLAEWLSLMAIAGTLFWSFVFLRRGPAYPSLEILLLTNMLYAVSTAIMMAVGRVHLGLEGAIASRYQTAALLFWGSLIAFVLLRAGTRLPARLSVAQVALLVLFLSTAARWATIERKAEERQFQLAEAWNAAIHERFGDGPAARLFFDREKLRSFVHYMQENHWGPSGDLNSFVQVRGTTAVSMLPGYTVSRSSCFGHIDEATRTAPGTLLVRGWAWSSDRARPADRVAFVAKTGRIAGFANVQFERPDVSAFYHVDYAKRSGWEATLTGTGVGTYHLFLILAGDECACDLRTELKLHNSFAFPTAK